MRRNGRSQKHLRNRIWFLNFGSAAIAPCYWCGKDLTFKRSTLDHVTPKSRGGTNNLDNLVLACRECNHRRNKEDHKRYKEFYRTKSEDGVAKSLKEKEMRITKELVRKGRRDFETRLKKLCQKDEVGLRWDFEELYPSAEQPDNIGDVLHILILDALNTSIPISWTD